MILGPIYGECKRLPNELLGPHNSLWRILIINFIHDIKKYMCHTMLIEELVAQERSCMCSTY